MRALANGAVKGFVDLVMALRIADLNQLAKLLVNGFHLPALDRCHALGREPAQSPSISPIASNMPTRSPSFGCATTAVRCARASTRPLAADLPQWPRAPVFATRQSVTRGRLRPVLCPASARPARSRRRFADAALPPACGGSRSAASRACRSSRATVPSEPLTLFGIRLWVSPSGRHARPRRASLPGNRTQVCI